MSEARAGRGGRDAIVGRLFELFRTAGFAGVSISEISQATGLGKSSLYHHFPGGKADMSAAVLDMVAAWTEAHVVEALAAPGSRADKVDRMLEAIDGLYRGGEAPCLLASMLVGVEGAPPPRLTAVVASWRDALASALAADGVPDADARCRAEDAIAAVQGALILARALADPRPFRGALGRVRERLLA